MTRELNRMKLKKIAVVSMAVAAVAFTGCGSNADGSGADTINLWLPTLATDTSVVEQTAWDELLAPFEKEHGVDVNVTITPWSSYEEKYLTGVSSGNGPDLGYMYTEMMGDYIKQGGIVPFDGYLKSDETAQYNYLDQGKVDGKQYALPFVVGAARLTYVNMDILKDSGVAEVPQTWDEYLSAAAKIKAAGHVVTTQPWGSPDRGMLSESFIPLLWQAGGELFSADGSKTAFNSPEGLEAAQFIKTLLDDGYMDSNVSGLTADETRQQFIDGKVAFLADAQSWASSNLTDAGFEVGVVNSLEKKERGIFAAVDSLVLMDKCSDKQMCTDLAAYILSGEQMQKLHEWAAYPPVGSDEKAASPTIFTSVYSEDPEVMRSLPVVAGGNAAYNVLYQNLQQMVLGQKSPEDALSDAAEAGDASLSSQG